MREIRFCNKNKGNWAKIEKMLTGAERNDPDLLSDLYIQLTDDLAYTQSNYPGSKTEQYLNHLVASVHRQIYRNRKEKTGRIKKFFTTEFPMLMYRQRKSMIISLVVFAVSSLIGVYSTYQNVDFVRQILGDAYVDKTIENIESGHPLGIYSSMDALPMFLQITFNNIRVSFMVFAFGLFFSIGSGYMLLSNGIMLGCFQYFFHTKNLLAISFLTIWVHGVLEITSIIIAGGAGIALGNSFMFPGTYSRKVSFQRGARESVKIIAGLVPIFIVAGFLEGFVTRYSEISIVPASIIIVISITFVVAYFIYYPYKLSKSKPAADIPNSSTIH